MDERQDQRRDYPLTIPDALLQSDAMREACSSRNFQEVFRLVNRRTGSSHAMMAAAVGRMTSSRVSDIIRGVRGIRGQEVIERVADGFGIPGEMLGLPRRPWEGSTAGISSDVPLSEQTQNRPTGRGCVETGGLDEMLRRDFLRTISVASALISVPRTQTVTKKTQEPAASGNTAESCERINSHLWQVFSLSTSKRAIYPVVREQLAAVTDSLKRVVGQKDHRRLCAAAGDLFQVAGEIFFDSNRYTDAAQCYTLAASASKEAGQYDLWACALTRHAFIGMYEQKFSDTVPMLEAAERIAQLGDSRLSTRYWVAAVQAQAFASIGDFDACRRALDYAEQVRSLSGDVHNGGWLRFEGSRLAEERGTCYLALDRPDLAEAALTDALKQPLSSRRRGSVLIDLATIGVQRRDIDQLVSYADTAIQLSRQTESGYVTRKLQGLQARLAPLNSEKRVSRLIEQISTLEHVG